MLLSNNFKVPSKSLNMNIMGVVGSAHSNDPKSVSHTPSEYDNTLAEYISILANTLLFTMSWLYSLSIFFIAELYFILFDIAFTADNIKMMSDTNAITNAIAIYILLVILALLNALPSIFFVFFSLFGVILAFSFFSFLAPAVGL